jgi:hypothetical protein
MAAGELRKVFCRRWRMKRVSIWIPACTFVGMLLIWPHSCLSQSAPRTFPPPEPDYPRLQIDQPPAVVHGNHRRKYDPVKIKKQADQLSKLAQSIPPDVDKVSHGQLPKELLIRLKQIEKLSKQLRRELAQ